MNKKILIIEDDNDIISNIAILLSENRYTALRAEDLVICDIMMPGLNGYEVLEEFAKDRNLKSVPFIFLTAKIEKHDFRKGMEMGADDYVMKPFSALDLLNAVKTRLKRADVFRDSMPFGEDKSEERRYSKHDNIYVKINGKAHFIRVSQISSITSERQYTSLKHLNGKVFIMRKSISYWEKVLPKGIFVRIHRSTIINFDLIDRTENTGGSSIKIYLKNNDKPFCASKRYSAKLKKNLI